ncbi:MAG: BMP family lipoprotein [Actinomycetota bacterium]
MRGWKRAMALGAVVTLALGACGGDDDDDATEATEPGTEEPGTDASDKTVGLVYDVGGRGDLSFNDSAAEGYDQAQAEFGFQTEELEPAAGGENRGELLNTLSGQGPALVLAIGFAFADAVTEAAAAFPDVHYAIVDSVVDAPNVASLTFAEEQGSFLVCAAAALKSQSGKIGFIGGVETELIQKFEAGCLAGATEVDPEIEVDVKYISPAGDFSGFNDPAKAREIATAMYDGGADVVYHAAGGSGAGLFEAAAATGRQGEVWAIGVDSDQYQTAAAETQPYILTSMLKRVNVAVYETAKAEAEDAFAAGVVNFDLGRDGVNYATSGDQEAALGDDIISQLEELKRQIIDGEIEVPTTP